MPILSHLDTV